jgi:hypothetical protein
MHRDQSVKQAAQRQVLPAEAGRAAASRPVAPSWSAVRPPDITEVLAIQRLAGNRAAIGRIAALRGQHAGAGPASIQRLAIYGRAAAAASALPAETATEFQRHVEAGNQAQAVSTVVAAMTARGELDPRLLRTSGDIDLWRVRDIGDLAAQVSFRPPFPDPDDATRRLPNPRFSISPGVLRSGRTDGLQRLHTGILHEYRHVEQAAERVNLARGSEAAREPGYANDPDEFDAYLSEVEQSYDRMHLYTAALQAGVHWEFLAATDRAPFRERWTAVQAKIRRVLGYDVATLMASPQAERYRERMREAERRAREAWERNAP